MNMKKQNRRDFLKSSISIAGAATATNLLLPKNTKASPENILSNDRFGVLVDTTVCIGCRKCEWACKTAHNLPAGDASDYDDKKVLSKRRGFSDRSANYWSLILNIPKNKILCLNRFYQKMQKSHWPH